MHGPETVGVSESLDKGLELCAVYGDKVIKMRKKARDLVCMYTVDMLLVHVGIRCWYTLVHVQLESAPQIR